MHSNRTIDRLSNGCESQMVKSKLTGKFFVANQQQLQPLRAGDVGDAERAAVAVRQALGADVLVQQLAVAAQEHDARAQLLLQQRLEQLEHHVEDEGLVDYVEALDPQRDALLERKYIKLTHVLVLTY